MKSTSQNNRIRRNAALALALASALLASCDSTSYKNQGAGISFSSRQLGGKKQIASVSLPDGMKINGFATDMEKSFSDGSKLIDNGIKAWGIVTSLNRYFDSEDATTAANAATRKTEIDASTEAARIASEERLAAQAMELEAAEAVVPAVPAP